MIINVIVFVGVLSVLVFVHELGHFLAAKFFGVYVKRFSVGLPPRLFGIQLGETDYCVGALPFGGFVMMAGQEDVPLTPEEREQEYGHVPPERWFKNIPIYQKIIVLLAGPSMNFLLAIVLYGMVGLVGSFVPEWEVEARVGVLEPNSPVTEAPLYLINADGTIAEQPSGSGWQIGDRILSVDGREISSMTDLAILAVLGGEGKTYDILLEREDTSGNKTRFLSKVSPKILDESKHPRFGVGPYETGVVEEVLAGSPAETVGFEPGDLIECVDGKPVTLSAFIEYIEATEEFTPVEVQFIRNAERHKISVIPKTIGRIRGLGLRPDSATNDSIVVVRVRESLQEETGLQPNDRIVEVNGQTITYDALMDVIEKNPGLTLELKVHRPRKLFGLINPDQTFMMAVTVDAVRAIGVALRPHTVLQRIPPHRILPYAIYQSYLAVERTLLTIAGLFAMTISPKELGGPLMIYEVTTKAAEAGFGWLLKITAFISVNLFILNLLPLPVLDGGQVMMNSIEAIRGKPVNEKLLERLQRIGIFLLIALMLYVTFNDIQRLVFGWLS